MCNKVGQLLPLFWSSLSLFRKASTIFFWRYHKFNPVSYTVDVHNKEFDGPRWVGPDDFSNCKDRCTSHNAEITKHNGNWIGSINSCIINKYSN